MAEKKWPWYMTIAALREYMQIADYAGPAEDDNPAFATAESELGAHCLVAHPVDDFSNRGGAMYYRTGRVAVGQRGKKTRLEFRVVPAPRIEGDKPQLVAVRDKDGGRSRRGGNAART